MRTKTQQRGEQKYGMKQNTSDASTSERFLQVMKQTGSRGTDACCTREATQRKRYRHEDGRGGEHKKRATRQEARKREMREKRNRTHKTVLVPWVPVSATKPIQGSCHALRRTILALISSGVKCQYCRCRVPPSHSATQQKLELKVY